MRKKLIITERSFDPMADPLLTPEMSLEMARRQLAGFAPNLANKETSGYSEADEYWHAFFPDADTRWIDFYSERSGCYNKKYVPNDVFYSEIDYVLNIPRRGCQLDDKSLYSLFFPDVRQPEVIGYVVRGLCMTADYQVSSLNEFQSRCLEHERVVIKPARYTCGGDDVRVCTREEMNEIIKRCMVSGLDYVIQCFQKQHQMMASLNSSSLNTIRTMSYMRTCGKVVNLGSVVRVGKPGMPVDNVSRGGYTIGVTKNGVLKDTGFDHSCQRLLFHSEEGNSPAGKAIPGYSEMKECISWMHRVLSQHRLLSWDFGIDEDGRPVFIEVNIYRSEIDFMQLNNGPLFGEYTDEVIYDVNKLKRLG